MYQLYTEVIKSSSRYYVFDEIEDLRQTLLQSNQQIAVQDLGAGSRVNKTSQRKIKDIARHSLKSAKTAQLLFRLVNYFEPKVILDLGTSLGITTLYLSAAHTNNQVFTFEGCPQTLAVAQTHFASFGFEHIIPVAGNIDFTLPTVLGKIEKVDFVFFDANHRLEPTLAYFQACLSKAQEQSVFVFDDIYWSAPMHQAWHKLKTSGCYAQYRSV